MANAVPASSCDAGRAGLVVWLFIHPLNPLAKGAYKAAAKKRSSLSISAVAMPCIAREKVLSYSHHPLPRT